MSATAIEKPTRTQIAEAIVEAHRLSDQFTAWAEAEVADGEKSGPGWFFGLAGEHAMGMGRALEDCLELRNSEGRQ